MSGANCYWFKLYTGLHPLAASLRASYLTSSNTYTSGANYNQYAIWSVSASSEACGGDEGRFIGESLPIRFLTKISPESSREFNACGLDYGPSDTFPVGSCWLALQAKAWDDDPSDTNSCCRYWTGSTMSNTRIDDSGVWSDTCNNDDLVSVMGIQFLATMLQ